MWADIIRKNMTRAHQKRYGHRESSHREEDNQKLNEARVRDKSKESRAVNRETPGEQSGGPNKAHLSLMADPWMN